MKPNPPLEFGSRFGRWLVVGRVVERGKILCRCDCGTERAVCQANVLKGVSGSCGCLRSEVSRKTATRHGQARKTSAYTVWSSMLARCRNPNVKSYRYYGAKGVAVCERWLSFQAFFADMGERPAGRSLDRINPNGNYEPGNCRWSTYAEQARNKTTKKLSAEDAQWIRWARAYTGATQKAIGEAFGVTQSMVSLIERGLEWV